MIADFGFLQNGRKLKKRTKNCFACSVSSQIFGQSQSEWKMKETEKKRTKREEKKTKKRTQIFYYSNINEERVGVTVMCRVFIRLLHIRGMFTHNLLPMPVIM